MGWWLRFVGGTCIVVAILVIILIVVAVILVGAKVASDRPEYAPALLIWMAASPFRAALYVAGLMATGAVCYVGGRALQHMDRTDRRGGRVRYVERAEPRRRARPPAEPRPNPGEAPVRRARPRRRR